ncbi:hypothetical protein VNO77_03106 [Canavalia gladiata]|uniref:Peptidase M16 N-terminal domain-containing protein n=1 Tax=Canavalia gladiata TaxID=3824 RepID=A0AAN9MU63_CANGL
MIEHFAFLGSKKREKLLAKGARSNAYNDFHHTVFHIHAPTTTQDSDGDLVPFVLDALNERALHPKFLASRIEKERRAILSELQMMNTIEYRVDCRLLQHLHSENKLSKSAFGAMASFLVPKLSVGLGGNSIEKSADTVATIQACVKARSTLLPKNELPLQAAPCDSRLGYGELRGGVRAQENLEKRKCSLSPQKMAPWHPEEPFLTQNSNER